MMLKPALLFPASCLLHSWMKREFASVPQAPLKAPKITPVTNQTALIGAFPIVSAVFQYHTDERILPPSRRYFHCQVRLMHHVSADHDGFLSAASVTEREGRPNAH